MPSPVQDCPLQRSPCQQEQGCCQGFQEVLGAAVCSVMDWCIMLAVRVPARLPGLLRRREPNLNQLTWVIVIQFNSVLPLEISSRLSPSFVAGQRAVVQAAAAAAADTADTGSGHTVALPSYSLPSPRRLHRVNRDPHLLSAGSTNERGRFSPHSLRG